MLDVYQSIDQAGGNYKMSMSVSGNTVAASAAAEVQKPVTPPTVPAQSSASTAKVDTVSLSAAAHAAIADADHDGDSH